jgi:hypothetical protein
MSPRLYITDNGDQIYISNSLGTQQNRISVKKMQKRFYFKDGKKIMRLKPKDDIGRAGKTKINEPIVECCMGKELAKGYSKGRAKKRKLYNKMIRKEEFLAKSIKKIEDIILK